VVLDVLDAETTLARIEPASFRDLRPQVAEAARSLPERPGRAQHLRRLAQRVPDLRPRIGPWMVAHRHDVDVGDADLRRSQRFDDGARRESRVVLRPRPEPPSATPTTIRPSRNTQADASA